MRGDGAVTFLLWVDWLPGFGSISNMRSRLGTGHAEGWEPAVPNDLWGHRERPKLVWVRLDAIMVRNPGLPIRNNTAARCDCGSNSSPRMRSVSVSSQNRSEAPDPDSRRVGRFT